MNKKLRLVLSLLVALFITFGLNVEAADTTTSKPVSVRTVHKNVKKSSGKIKVKKIKKWHLPKGTKKVISKGRKKQVIYTYKHVYKNGKLVSKKQVKKKVIKAKKRVIHIGVGAKTKDLNRLAKCESGGRYKINTGNGYYGAFQFNYSTWNSYRKKAKVKAKYPHKASKKDQQKVTRLLQYKRGWSPWPACSAKLGLR